MPFIPQNALNKSSLYKQQAHVMLSFHSKVGLNSIGSFKRRNVQARATKCHFKQPRPQRLLGIQNGGE